MIATQEEDATLVARALDGDDAAFTALVSRHKSWLFRFIDRYVGDPADAYDVLQDTFFAVWRALARYQPDRPFDIWVRRIALNKCRDRARRETVRRLLSGWSGDEPPDVADPAPGPATLTESAEQLHQLEHALQQLPRQLKEPLLLTTIEGLSHKDAGAVLGINAKAVEMRVYRARARLRELSGISS